MNVAHMTHVYLQLTHMEPPFRLFHRLQWYKAYVLRTNYTEKFRSDEVIIDSRTGLKTHPQQSADLCYQ